MSDLVLIVPSRGRPQSAKRLADVVEGSASAHIRFVVDADDSTLPEYLDTVDPDTVLVFPGGRPGIVDPLNWAAAQHWHAWDYIGFAGDDHLPRTPDWDVQIIETLRQLSTGVCYGNDLLMGEKIPTAVFMTSDIPRTLGYMAPPALAHLFVDNAWKDWGQGIGKLKYLDDVIIEHLHPLNGKSDWDPTYERCNDPNVQPDRVAYQSYQRLGLRADLGKLKGLL